MAVAKSFTNFEKLGEPFKKNNKMYINVRNQKTGTKRAVRWYTDAEYAKLYPETVLKEIAKPYLKQSLGFSKGYITVLKDADYDDEWCNKSVARWCGRWGWYIASTDDFPEDCPFEYKKLYWKDVIKEEGILKPREEIEQIIFQLFYDNSPSQHLGSVGDRLELNIEIINIDKVETNYGAKARYTFVDSNDNVLEWFTSLREDWNLKDKKIIRGTVKGLTRKHGLNITVLTRCMERK